MFIYSSDSPDLIAHTGESRKTDGRNYEPQGGLKGSSDPTR